LASLRETIKNTKSKYETDKIWKFWKRENWNLY
jgi:hypothetical protein